MNQTKEIYYSQQGDFEFKKIFRPVSVNKVTIFRKKKGRLSIRQEGNIVLVERLQDIKYISICKI